MPLARFLAVLSLILASGQMLVSVSAFATEVEDINQQFRKGDLTGALQGANTYLAKNPKDAQVRFLKGLVLAEQGKANDAIGVFTGLTEDFPELPEPYNNLAVLYAAQNKFDDAKNALEMAIRAHPNYATAHENLGDIYAKMATLSYDKALQLDQNNPTVQAKLSLLKDIVSPASRRSTPLKSANVTPVAVPVVQAAPVVTPAQIPAVASPQALPVAPEQTLAGAEATVVAWARAWAAQDVDAHLAFYAGDFETPASLSRAEWETQRRERIIQPDHISVSLSGIKSREINPGRVSVSFKQTYQSDRLKATSSKVMELVWRINKWLIIQETTR